MASTSDFLLPTYSNQVVDPISGLTPSTTASESLFPEIGSFNYSPITRSGLSLTSKYDQDLFMFEDRDIQRSQTQPGIAQLGNALNQAIVGEVIGGTIEGIGWLTALDDAAKLISNDEVELGNWLTDIGKDLRTWTQEVTPIYTDPRTQGQFRPDRWSWWMSNAPSVASTLSLLIPAGGVVKGASMLGKAMGIGAQLGKEAAWMTSAISQAVVSRHMENLMEASGKYDEIIERGGTAEQASIAASDIYKANWAMILQDIPEYMVLGAGMGKAFEKVAPQVAKKLGTMGAMEANLRTAKSIATNIAGEGFEEAYQYVVSEYFDDLSRASVDPDYKVRHLGDFVKEGDFWTSAFFGMMGAGVFHSVGRYVNEKILGAPSEVDTKLKAIKDQAVVTRFALAHLKNAEERGDVEAVENIKVNFISKRAATAIETGTLQAEIDKYTQVLGKDKLTEEDMAYTGLDQESIKYIETKWPDFINTFKEVGEAYERIFDQLEGDNKRERAAQLAALEVEKAGLFKQVKNINQQVDNLRTQLNESSSYMNLSSNGKKLFEYNSDLSVLSKQYDFVNNILKNPGLPEETIDKYKNERDKIRKEREKLAAERKELKNEEGYRNTEEAENDENNIATLPKHTLTEYNNLKSKIKNIVRTIQGKQEHIDSIEKLTKVKTENIVEKKSPEKVEKEAKEAQDKLEQAAAEERVQEKEEEAIAAKYVRKKAGQLIPKTGDFVEVEMLTNAGEVTRGILKKEDTGYTFTDFASNEIINIDLTANDTLSSKKIVVVKEPADSMAEEVTIVDKTPIKSDDIGSSIPWDGKVTYELGYKIKEQINAELNKYLSNANNDLSGAFIEPFIDFEDTTLQKNKNLLNRLKSGNTDVLTEEDIATVPLGARLIVDGEIIPGKMWIYFPNAEQYPRQQEFRREDRPAYSEAFDKESIKVRKNIIPLLVKGQQVRFTKIGKTRGLIRNTFESTNVTDALGIELKEVKGNLGVVVKSGDILGEGAKTLGLLENKASRAGAGSILLRTTKTANKNPIWVKLNPVKLGFKDYDYGQIIFDAFSQALSGTEEAFSIKHQGTGVKGDISVGFVLDMLVNHGNWTNVNIEVYHSRADKLANPERYQELYRKQLYYSKAKDAPGGTIFYSADYKNLDVNGNPKPFRISTTKYTIEQLEHFKKTLKENMNMAVRYKKFGDTFSYTGPFKIGNLEVTKQDIKNKLTYEEFIVANEYVKANVENVDGSITKSPYIVVDTNELENISTPEEVVASEEDIVSYTNTAEPSGEISPEIAAIFRKTLGSGLHNRIYKGQSTYTKWDKDKELKRVRRIIGNKFPIEITDDFIKVVDSTGSHKAFGQVSRGSMKLYKANEKGTAYHEAFHVVSIYYLTDEEREALYTNARRTYPELTKADNKTVEEFLAEEFRKYVLSLPTKKLSTRIKEFFERLLSFITNIFVDRTTRLSKLSIEQVFNKIETGTLVRPKVQSTPATDDVYRFLREEFTLQQVNKIADGLFHLLVTLNNITTVESINNINFDIVRDRLRTFRDQIRTSGQAANASENTKKEAERLAHLYDRVSSDELWGKFQYLMESRLKALNIKRDETYNEDSDDVTSNEFKIFESASYEFDAKDSVLTNIKLFIATLPVENDIDSYTYMYNLLDFQSAWSRIMKDAWKARNIYDLERILETKSKRSLFYKTLLNGNEVRWGIKNAPEEFRTQVEVGFNKYKHDFINLVREDNSYKVYSAGIESGEKIASIEWGTMFSSSDEFFDKENKPIQSKLDQIATHFKNNVYTPAVNEYTFQNRNNFPNFDHYKDLAIQELSKLHISIDSYTMDDLLETLGNGSKQDGLYTLYTEILQPIFDSSSNGFIGSLKSGSAFKTKKGKRIPIEQVMFRDSRIKRLAKLVVEHNDNYIMDTVLGPDNAMFYVYSQSNFLTDFNKRNYKPDEKGNPTLSEEGEALLNSSYAKHSYFKQALNSGKELTVKTLANVRNSKRKKVKGYLDLSPKEDFLAKLHVMLEGYLPMPTLADRKSYYVYSGIDPLVIKTYSEDTNGNIEIPEAIVDIFLGYIIDEKDRIDKVRADIDEAIESKNYKGVVKNMHYLKVDANGIPILTDDKGNPLYNSNGLKYHIFPEFNDFKGNVLDVQNLRKILANRINDTIQLAITHGIIERASNNNYTNKGIDTFRLSGKKSSYGNETRAIKAIMAEYTINTIISGVETDKLLVGDAAFYENIENKIKRINAIVAPGDKLRVEYREGEFAGRTQYTTATLQDHTFNASDLIKDLAAKFLAKGLSEEQVKARLKAYEKVNVTDAQAYITPIFHRELKIRLGEWSDKLEEAFNLLMSGEDIPSDKVELVNDLIMEPVKFVYYDLHAENGYMVPVYDKMSMATLWPKLVEGTKLQTLYERMNDENDPINLVKFESAVKVGGRPSPKYFTDDAGIQLNNEELGQWVTYKQNLSNLRRQQITTPHKTPRRLLATQVKKIVMANLKAGVDYTVNGKKVNKDKVAEYLNESYSALSKIGLNKLSELLGLDLTNNTLDIKKLYDTLRIDAINGNLPQQIIDALLIDEDTDMTLLDTLPDRKWVESRLQSLASKYIIDLMTPGDGFAQMSNFGLHKTTSDKLKLIDGDNQTEIMVSIGLYKNVIPDYNKKTFEEKKDWLREHSELFEGIGYRIPTQGQNSVISFKVVDFLDERSGNTVILPSEFTALTGSDFDIDKLFLAVPNYYTSGSKLIKYEFIEGDATGKITDESDLEELWKQHTKRTYGMIMRLENIVSGLDNNVLNEADQEYLRVHKPQFIDDLGRVKVEEIAKAIKELNDSIPTLEEFIKSNKGKNEYDVNTEQAIQNRVLDTMKAVITNEEHILETKTPLDAFTGILKNIANKYRELIGKTKGLASMEAYAPAYQHSVKESYTGGKKGIGPFALHNVHHALTQVYNVLFNSSSAEIGNISEEGRLDLAAQVGVKYEKSPQNNIFIIDWLSALINAHVDIAKDPYIFELNINSKTYDIVNYLIRAGVGEKAFWFMLQPGVTNYEDRWYNTFFTKGKADKGYTDQELQDILDSYSLSNIFNQSIEELQADITEGQKPVDERSLEWFAKQYKIKQHYTIIAEDAKKLSRLVKLSRVDGKGYGTTINDILDFQEDYEGFLLKNNFVNGNAILTDSFIGKYYNNFTKAIGTMMSNVSISADPVFRDIFKYTMRGIKKPQLDDPKYTKEPWLYSEDLDEYDRVRHIMENMLFASLAARHFKDGKGFALLGDNVNDLFKGKNSVGARLYNAVINHPELKNNAFVKHIKPVKPFTDEEALQDMWLIKALDGDKGDRFQRDNIIDGWEALLEHKDVEIRKLAEDLIVASFYMSAFSRNLYSYYHNIPISFLMKSSDFNNNPRARSYNEYIKALKSMFKSGNLAIDYFEVIDDVIANTIDEIPTVQISGTVHSSDGNPYAIVGLPTTRLNYNVTVTRRFKSGKDETLYGRYIGKEIETGKPIYRVIHRKGLNSGGHKLYEFNETTSIVNPYETLSFENVVKLLNVNDKIGAIDYITDKFNTPTDETVESTQATTTTAPVQPTPTAPLPDVTPVQQEIGTQLKLFDVPIDTSNIINIYAGTNENLNLSNLAIRPFTLTEADLDQIGLEELIPMLQNIGINNLKFNSVEQFFQLSKYLWSGSSYWEGENKPLNNDDKVAKQIMTTNKTGTIKKLGREFKLLEAGEFNQASTEIMRKALYESFRQNPKALAELLATGNKKITHIQDNTKWKTLFPELLMDVRYRLSRELELYEEIRDISIAPPKTELSEQETKDLFNKYKDCNLDI